MYIVINPHCLVVLCSVCSVIVNVIKYVPQKK